MADGGSAVGFGFQTDVVNLASLTHLITGRILKAMSDGGIDFYAVAASMWLGKYVPVQSSLQTTVHAHIQAKSTNVLHGFLAKALSIGWGHSAVPLEMSRTKAGTNALLLIGALSTGCSPYVAAQCLSEVLTICGLESDKAPTVDVLKPLIIYLAPFVQDMGFSKVLEHITTAVSRQTHDLSTHVTGNLNAVGEAPVLAAAIKQLVFTSERGESIYLITRQRGSWLATFANHILGMEVEILFDETVVWASSGTNGRVVLDLAQSIETKDSLQHGSGSRAGIYLVMHPTTKAGHLPVVIDYAMSDILQYQIQRHHLDSKVAESIQCAIVRMSSALLKDLRMTNVIRMSIAHPINGHFLGSKALRDTLEHFNIPPEIIDRHLNRDNDPTPSWAGKIRTETHGLRYLQPIEVQGLKSICHIHSRSLYGDAEDVTCICYVVGGIIHDFASTIVALLQCRYDHNHIRIYAGVLDGSISTGWSRGCILEAMETHHKALVYGHQLFEHLSELVHGPHLGVSNGADLRGSITTATQNAKAVLGVSLGAYTVNYTCLLQEDCYDDFGRFITISDGRASVQGMLRQLLVENNDPFAISDMNIGSYGSGFTSLVSGAYVEPHYYPTRSEIFMITSITENEILIQTRIGLDPWVGRSTRVSLTRCILSTLAFSHPTWPCKHKLDERIQIRQGNSFVCGLDSFQGSFPLGPHGGAMSLVFVALKGRKLQQILYLGTTDPLLLEQRTLQLYSCLRCCLDIPHSGQKRTRYIIMAG